MKIISRKLNGISCIYIIKCLKNGKCYVGQTKNVYRRLREHKRDLEKNISHNPLMQADYNKYGLDAFDYEILYESDENLDEKEREYIQKYRELNSCYNIFSGGLTSFSATKEFKEAVSKRFKGIKHSEESKKKHSESTKRQWAECEGYAEKMSNNARNQWKNEEYRKIMLEAHLGKPNKGASKLSADDVINARKRYANGEKISELAKEHGVKYDAMYKAVHKVTWRYI